MSSFAVESGFNGSQQFFSNGSYSGRSIKMGNMTYHYDKFGRSTGSSMKSVTGQTISYSATGQFSGSTSSFGHQSVFRNASGQKTGSIEKFGAGHLFTSASGQTRQINNFSIGNRTTFF